MDQSLDRYAGKMIIVVIVASVLIAIVGAVFLQPYYVLGFILGVALSAGLNIFKIWCLKFTVKRATTMEGASASAFTSAMGLLRLVLTGLVLVAAHFLPVVNLFGAAVGLLSMPIAAYSINFFVRRDERNRVVSGNTEDNDDEA